MAEDLPICPQQKLRHSLPRITNASERNGRDFTDLSSAEVLPIFVQYHECAGIRVGESASVLLGAGTRRARDPPVYGQLPLRLRVHGSERSPGHHPAH